MDAVLVAVSMVMVVVLLLVVVVVVVVIVVIKDSQSGLCSTSNRSQWPRPCDFVICLH